MLADHMPPREILFKCRIHRLRQACRRIIHLYRQSMLCACLHMAAKIVDMRCSVALLLSVSDRNTVDPHPRLSRPLQEQDNPPALPVPGNPDPPLINCRPCIDVVAVQKCRRDISSVINAFPVLIHASRKSYCLTEFLIFFPFRHRELPNAGQIDTAASCFHKLPSPFLLLL